jgi:hypothetical protein
LYWLKLRFYKNLICDLWINCKKFILYKISANLKKQLNVLSRVLVIEFQWTFKLICSFWCSLQNKKNFFKIGLVDRETIIKNHFFQEILDTKIRIYTFAKKIVFGNYFTIYWSNLGNLFFYFEEYIKSYKLAYEFIEI